MSRQAPQGPKRVAGGKRSAAPGQEAVRESSPGGATEGLSQQSFLSPLPGLVCWAHCNPGLRFACPGLLSARRSAAGFRFFHSFEDSKFLAPFYAYGSRRAGCGTALRLLSWRYGPRRHGAPAPGRTPDLLLHSALPVFLRSRILSSRSCPSPEASARASVPRCRD